MHSLHQVHRSPLDRQLPSPRLSLLLSLLIPPRHSHLGNLLLNLLLSLRLFQQPSHLRYQPSNPQINQLRNPLHFQPHNPVLNLPDSLPLIQALNLLRSRVVNRPPSLLRDLQVSRQRNLRNSRVVNLPGNQLHNHRLDLQLNPAHNPRHCQVCNPLPSLVLYLQVNHQRCQRQLCKL